uniref:Uncharacterized protein n=1 Tax=Anguilla anguilla TaxID=7936 RepID=A0A0E9R0F4_ANGAN
MKITTVKNQALHRPEAWNQRPQEKGDRVSE